MNEEDKRIKPNVLNKANKEIAILNQEKKNQVKELAVAYKEIAFQIEERGKRATELAIANIELVFQNEEKEKRLTELRLANVELQQAEADIRKLNANLEHQVIKRTAQYAFISQINQTIVHVKNAETLFRKSCSVAIEFGKFKMAWIGRFDVAQKITLLDFSGIAKQDIKLFTDAAYVSNSPQDYVLRTGKYFHCKDIKHAFELESWKSYAVKHDISSCIIVPIVKSGSIYGTFNLYAGEANFFDDEIIKLAIEATGDISFALDLFEKAEKQVESEKQIIKNEKRFRALIENSSDMITLTSKEGIVLYGSPSITKLFGYSPDDIINTATIDYIHPEDKASFTENRLKLLETPGNSCHNQVRLKHKNGNWVWCDATLTNMLDESGIEAMVSNFRDISDKKATENQQEFETNNLNALINNTKDLMWSVDRNYNLITSNIPFDEAGKVNFGKAIAKGENVLSASYTPEMLSHFKELYERAFAGESFTEIERFHLPFELWTQISYYPIRRGNNIIGTACHSRDITGIKKIEQQLSKSEAFNRGVLNSLSSHIAVINDLGNIVAVNESWKQFAIENGDTSLLRTAKGTNYFSVCKKAAESGDEIAHEVLLGMKAILDEKDSNFYLEYPCHSPNEQRWFGMRAMKFDSDAPMIVVAHMDITERKLAEEKLIESEARLKEAQAIAHISNWEYDLITNKSVWSDEFYSILGINRNEIKASPELFLSMIHPDDFEFAKSKVDKTFQTFESESFSVRIINKNGNIRYVFTEWKTEFDTNNNPIRLFGILKDETERKIAEDEREKLILDILQRNRDLEQFTFIISHNLRAPTANIIGFTEILNNEKLSLLEQKELLHGLASSVSGLDTIIKDINSILQVKREINDKKEVVVFSKLVNDIIVSIEKVIDMHNVRFTIDFSDVDEMFSLKAYMHSIFYNLISNSIKYRNPDIQPLIEIKSKQEHKKIILTFKDNGLGIDLKTKGDKIFGLYKRFHSHVEGKGLGLFMVKTQVEAIGGKISLTSEVNKGTEFTIEFEI